MPVLQQTPQGMPPSLPRSLAEQAMQLQRAAGPPINLAPFSIQKTMSGKQLKGANAAANCMQKVSHAAISAGCICLCLQVAFYSLFHVRCASTAVSYCKRFALQICI